MSTEEKSFDTAAKEILVKLVTSLLTDKPNDPVRHHLLNKRFLTFTLTCWTFLKGSLQTQSQRMRSMS